MVRHAFDRQCGLVGGGSVWPFTDGSVSTTSRVAFWEARSETAPLVDGEHDLHFRLEVAACRRDVGGQASPWS